MHLPFMQRFPALTAWDSVELTRADLRRALSAEQGKSLDRVLRGGCRTIGDLIKHSEASVTDWRAIGAGKAAGICDLVRALDLVLSGGQAPELNREPGEGPIPVAGDADPGWEELVRRFASDFDYDAAMDVNGASGYEERDSDVPGEALRLLQFWASSVLQTGGRADALRHALTSSSLPDDVAAALEELTQAPVGLDPFSDLGAILFELGLGDDRSRDILVNRITARNPEGLQTLGDRHQVTRERIRQLEARILDRVTRAYPHEDAMRVVRWLGHSIRVEVGAFAPVSAVDAVAPHLERGIVHLALRLEGYKFFGEHVAAVAFELPEVDELDIEAGVVDVGALVSLLVDRGVNERFVDDAIAAMPEFEWLGELLVTKTRNFVDRAVIVISQYGDEMDVDQLWELTAPEANKRGFRHRVFEDERFVRTAPNQVALAAWGLEQYTTITEAMSSAVQAGPWELEDLAEDLAERFGVSPSSVRFTARAPMFRISEGMLELRPDDDPYIPRNAVATVPGLFADPGDGRLRWNLVVDKEILRGSGRSAPPELATSLGVDPGDKGVLLWENSAIALSWPTSSHTGPRIGSLKAMAESLGCVAGDTLNLSIAVADNTVDATRILSTDLNQEHAFRTITGVRPSDLVGLRRALDCSGGEVAVLMKRGEQVLAEAVVRAIAAG